MFLGCLAALRVASSITASAHRYVSLGPSVVVSGRHWPGKLAGDVESQVEQRAADGAECAGMFGTRSHNRHAQRFLAREWLLRLTLVDLAGSEKAHLGMEYSKPPRCRVCDKSESPSLKGAAAVSFCCCKRGTLASRSFLQVSKSEATGENFEEAKKINWSLTALGQGLKAEKICSS